MMNKEEYKKEIVRMWDSVRTNSKGEHTCSGVQCEDCPLHYVGVCHSYGAANAYNVYEEAIKCIDYVERWSKEHPQTYKVSKLEYDILEENLKWVEGAYYLKFYDIMQLAGLLKKGYFKGATREMNVKDYFDNCEVE